MSEEMDALAINTNPALDVREGSERLRADLDYFDESFYATFPQATEADRYQSRYWYLVALARASKYEEAHHTAIELALNEALAGVQALRGEME